MYYVYQQTASYQDRYVQIGANADKEAAIAAAKEARANGGTCAVVTSVDNTQGLATIGKPSAGVVYDSSAR